MQLFAHTDTKKILGIVGALSVSGAMIAAAYFFSGPNIFSIPGANAEDTKKLLEAYAVKDSDADGLPDWQEALYGTNPQDPHSVDKTLTDGQAVAQGLVKPKFESAPIATSTVDVASIPGVTASSTTLTDQFARELFTQYIQSTGSTPATPDQVASFVTGAVGNLNQMYVAPVGYRLVDIHTQGTGTDALRAYAATSEQLFFTNTPGFEKDESSYLYDAVTQDDTSAPAKIAKIGAWYTKVGKAAAQTSVPTELAAPQLRLANALLQIGSITTDMSTITSDPLRALLAIGRYDAALTELLASFQDIAAVFTKEGVSFSPSDSGYLFFSMLGKQ